jgi:hypothetical protein
MTKEERKRRDKAILFGRINGDKLHILASRYELSHGRISKILQSQGMRSHEMTAIKHKQVISMLKEGKTRKEIAVEMGYYITTVEALALKYGFSWKPQKILCKICGDEFMQKTYHQSCCSLGCSYEYKKQRTMRYITKTCEFCGKAYRLQVSVKYRKRFCTTSCAQKALNKSKEIRNDEIWWLREEQKLTFVRIGEIFEMGCSTARSIYIKQKKIRALEDAELIGV